MEVLKIEGLTKHYGKIKAVNDLNLRVEKGQIMGILGPNGSGKTTTLGMVMEIIRPNRGNFSWFEQGSSPKLRKRIGTLLETPNFFPYLSAEENLRIVSQIKRVSPDKNKDLLKLVNLFDRRTSKFRTFSLGMKQRLGIAAALIGDPEVLIFDEPTNGLDPEGIKEVRDLILDIAQQGRTIIMASHILDEVEKICSHVAIIKKGNLLADGLVGSVIRAEPSVELNAINKAGLSSFLEKHPKVNSFETKNGYFLAHIDKDCTAEELNADAQKSGILLSRLLLRKRSLEEEFLELTKGG